MVYIVMKQKKGVITAIRSTIT